MKNIQTQLRDEILKNIEVTYETRRHPIRIGYEHHSTFVITDPDQTRNVKYFVWSATKTPDFTVSDHSNGLVVQLIDAVAFEEKWNPRKILNRLRNKVGM